MQGRSKLSRQHCTDPNSLATCPVSVPLPSLPRLTTLQDLSVNCDNISIELSHCSVSQGFSSDGVTGLCSIPYLPGLGGV